MKPKTKLLFFLLIFVSLFIAGEMDFQEEMGNINWGIYD